MNKCVLITAGTKNTGGGIAELFASEGYDVIVTSLDKADAVSCADWLSDKYGIKAYGFKFDLCSEDDMTALTSELDALGCVPCALVLCAANLGIGQSTLTVSREDFSRVISANVIGNFMLAREIALRMKDAGGGSIVFISSNTAYRAIPDRAAYVASKNGILGLVRALALDLGGYGIRVNAVLPGMIKTDRWDTNLNGCRESSTAKTPLGDIAEFRDIAGAVLYFATDLSRNTTGAELIVDGGNSIRL